MGSSGSTRPRPQPVIHQTMAAPSAPMYSNAPPPPYSQQPPPAPGYGNPTPGYGNVAPGFTQQPYGYQGVQPVAQPAARPGPGGTVVVQGGFDAGARFDPGQPVNIPPPPPGFAPNTAQAAAMQGQNVVVTQREGGFWSGSGDGGMVIW